ncbi:Flavin monooxygenase-like protein [Cordyceps fumosorosea ARSEF 2679]|uniref:Flavin monooxygenase-like protein n=1 Tax=Cordyceps fumosorosea (strain ARSEF 2679) TaxID=1081104 RepID=A0A167LEM7_CORFA|nr:Flavin monooxygenase-like protein [Cordyceps fumosorosea ARSEF 2679]OAA52996.1 Flavin monooxygenase-like protein [Cordyceps fumosorosea ARSEF 2679]
MAEKKWPSSWDVVIVGAGMSGINAAHHIQKRLPHFRVTILEERSRIGGTWDFFKYPGLRSDTDLHSFGFGWRPWKENRAIADGPSIVRYLEDAVKEDGTYHQMQFETHVVSASWSTKSQSWHIAAEKSGVSVNLDARFMILATGYYDYKEALRPNIAGLDNPQFKGQVIHPQFWPEGLDYDGKDVVIIGSGATAVTILPSMAERVNSVTMLQRSPAYIMSINNKTGGSWLHKILPQSWSFKLDRLFFICFTACVFYFCRLFPVRSRAMLEGAVAKQLPSHVSVDPHFHPRYQPWDQRVCMAPDGDFFKSLHSGKAAVETGVVKATTEDSLILDSGKTLKADIVITATGLKLRIGGHINFSVDGKPINLAERHAWRSALLQDIPNLAFMLGYVNASWTLGSEVTSEYICRILQRMERSGKTSVVPRKQKQQGVALNPQPIWNLAATYVKESQREMPVCGHVGPWRERTIYFWDLWQARYGSITDCLEYSVGY